MKKNLFYSIFFSLLWPVFVAAQINQAVTYGLGQGRFGDKILAYVGAKWVSFKFNIPLFVKPFRYSSMLRFSREEKQYSKEIAKKFKKVILINSEQGIIRHEEDNVLFETKGVYFRISGYPQFRHTVEYMLQDQHLVTELKNMLQPVVPLPQVTLPQDKVTVAVHIRKGGGFDQPLSSIQYYRVRYYADKKFPLKFPPEQYYADQIKRISKLFDDAPLFVHIFTDDRNPLRLVDRIEKEVNRNNITFSCRNRGNAHDAHVVEDFYNMARFDCLVRSSSNFAIAT